MTLRINVKDTKKTHLTMTFKINAKVSRLKYFNDVFKRVDCIHHIKSCRSSKVPFVWYFPFDQTAKRK